LRLGVLMRSREVGMRPEDQVTRRNNCRIGDPGRCAVFCSRISARIEWD